MYKKLYFSAHTAAKQLDMNPKTLRSKLEDLEPDKLENGVRYFTMKSLFDHLAYSDQGVVNPKLETSLLNKARREKIEFDLSVEKKKYIEFNSARNLIVNMVLAAKTKFLAMESKLIPLIPSITDEIEAQKLVHPLILEALEELSENQYDADYENTETED